MTILTEIAAAKRAAVRARKGRRYLGALRRRIEDAGPVRPFQAALKEESGEVPRLIAEVKHASPSKGVIRKDFDPVAIAQTYAAGGAAAVSVLTETDYFLGDPDDLRRIRGKIVLPILQKDFILDDIQVYEGRAWGADAILLIAALLERNQIRDYFDLAQSLSLAVLVEVHTERELEGVIEWAPVIGINNRDLTTFKTDIETTFRLLREIPAGRTIVSESGIAAREQMVRLREAGVDAVLIGESLMASERIEDKIRALLNPREG